MSVVSMRQLLEAGIHFGHQTRRWNPKMGRYIFGQRNGIYIIDLQKTLRQLNKAYAVVRDSVAEGGTVLFVGTKKQAQDLIQREAERCGMYYIRNRWLGGTLTNFSTIKQSVRTLTRLEEMETSGKIQQLSKKEASRIRRERNKLLKNLAGIKAMDTLPTVMFVMDTRKEAIAVREASRLEIPCIGVVDTNADPDTVSIPIPGNDDALRAIGLFCRTIADAAIEGLSIAEKIKTEEKARSSAAAAAVAATAAAAKASEATPKEAGESAENAAVSAGTEVEGE